MQSGLEESASKRYPVPFAFYGKRRWPVCPAGKSQDFLFLTKLGHVRSAVITLIFPSRGSCLQNISTAINLTPLESFGGTGWLLVSFSWWLADEIVGRKQQRRSSQYQRTRLLKYIIPWATKNTFYLNVIFDRQLRADEMWLKHEVGKREERFPKATFFLLLCAFRQHNVDLSKARSSDLCCLFAPKLYSSEGGYLCIDSDVLQIGREIIVSVPLWGMKTTC